MTRWHIYLLVYFVGAGLILGTTCAFSQLVGTDSHVEIWIAKQTLEHGYNNSIQNSINSSLPISLIAPYLSKWFHIPLIWIFKVIYPMMFAFVPVLLLNIYSRFMPFKWALLASLFFIVNPVFFLELPQVERMMIAELLIVGMLAVLFSNLKDRYKYSLFSIGSLAIVVSHYSSVILWFILCGAILLAYLVKRQKQFYIVGGILVISLIAFYAYAKISSSGWQVEDVGNAVKGITSTIAQGGASSAGEVFKSTDGQIPTAIQHMGTAQSMIQVALGLDFFKVDLVSKLFRIIQWVVEVSLVVGVVAMLRKKTIPTAYKSLIVFMVLLLGLSIIFPIIASTINATRLYEFGLIILSPAFVYGLVWVFKRRGYYVAGGLLVVYFVFTSGLVFHFTEHQIATVTIPYSIALEAKALDAGNYLTADDSKVAEWAFNNGIKTIYGDTGAVLIAQEYFDNYHALPWGDLKSGDYLLIRTWDTQNNTKSVWAGAGLRTQQPLDVPVGKILYQSGGAYVMEVQ